MCVLVRKTGRGPPERKFQQKSSGGIKSAVRDTQQYDSNAYADNTVLPIGNLSGGFRQSLRAT